MGWEKDSLTEQQREKKIRTIILIKRIYRVQFYHQMMPTLLPASSPTQIPSMTSHGIEYSCWLASLRQPIRLLVRINLFRLNPGHSQRGKNLQFSKPKSWGFFILQVKNLAKYEPVKPFKRWYFHSITEWKQVWKLMNWNCWSRDSSTWWAFPLQKPR